MSDLDEMLTVGGQEMSLADLANVNMGDVEEFRTQIVPAGVLIFKLKSENAEEFIEKFSFTNDDDEEISGLRINIGLEIVDIVALNDAQNKKSGMPDVDREQAVGKPFVQKFAIYAKSQEEIAKGFGKVKAFLNDIGLNANSGSLQEVVLGNDGHMFQGKVTHSVNRNNADWINQNISLKQTDLKPYGGEAEAA